MIGLLRGTVESVEADAVLIDVGGVGYEVHMTSSDMAGLRYHHEATILTHLAISQDNVTLFGFLSKTSKSLFLQLQKVSGVGPKAALSLLSALSAEALRKAISEQDVTALTKAPGIGKKGAQKIILELSGTMASLDPSGPATNAGAAFNQAQPYAQEVIDGLVSLGWQPKDAAAAVQAVRQSPPSAPAGRSSEAEDISGQTTDISEAEVPQVLRLALSYLGRGDRR